MIDEKLKIVKEKILIVRWGNKVIFEDLFGKLHISEVFYHELSVLNNNTRDNIDVSSKDSKNGFIEIFGVLVLFGSELQLDVSHKCFEIFYFN